MAIKLTNNATSTLAASITSGNTTLSVQTADAGKFPTVGAGDWFPLTVVDTAGNMEIMRVTARAGAVLTVSRGQEGTTAKAFSAGARVDVRLTAAALDDGFIAPAERAKLAGIAPQATKNATDAQLRARSSHTGTQGVETITGLGGAATLNVGKTTGTVADGGAALQYQKALGGAEDLNLIREPGAYSQNQNAGAASGSNYPAPTAGLLEVIDGVASNVKTVQRYTLYSTGRLYWRIGTASAWSAWKEAVTPDMLPAQSNKRIYLSSATWTKPAGLSKVIVTVLGAGGGGGGAYRDRAGGVAGGAGGSGAAAIREIAAGSLGATVPVSVGAAGTGGNSSPYTGGDGGTSSFGSAVQATGGKGGTIGNSSTGVPAGTKGANGVGSGGAGTILLQPPVILNTTSTPDNNGLGWNAATATISNANAESQVTLGCGGPGAVAGVNGLFFGGDGAPGLVIVEEYF